MYDTIIGRFYTNAEREAIRNRERLQQESREKAYAGYKEAYPRGLAVGDLAVYCDRSNFFHLVRIEAEDENEPLQYDSNNPYIPTTCLTGATHFYLVDYRDCTKVVPIDAAK